MKKIIVGLLMMASLYGENDVNKTYNIKDIVGTWEKKLEHKQDNVFIVKVKSVTNYRKDGNYSSRDSYIYSDMNNTLISSYDVGVVGKWEITKNSALKIAPTKCQSRLVEKNNENENIFKETNAIHKMMCMFNIPTATEIIDISSNEISTKEGISLRVK